MIERADSTFGTAATLERADQPTESASAGQLLRAAREATGLHIAALAAALKVPVAKLDALENDRSDLLPDPVFARALAGSVCRTLKIDPRPVLQRLPQPGHRLASDDAGLNAPFRGMGAGSSQPVLRDTVARPVIWAVAALLLGAAALYLAPQLEPLWERVKPAAGAPAASRGMPEAATPATPTSAAPAALPAAAGEAAALPAPTVATPPAATAAAAEPPAVPAGTVVFRARGVSWVQVTDARRTVVLERTLKAGDTVVAEGGSLPLAVVIGRADVTDVSVRGSAFDLAPHLRENVARFEVR